jgi:hypothetical protein
MRTPPSRSGPASARGQRELDGLDVFHGLAGPTTLEKGAEPNVAVSSGVTVRRERAGTVVMKRLSALLMPDTHASGVDVLMRFDRRNALNLRHRGVMGMFRGIVGPGSCLV